MHYSAWKKLQFPTQVQITLIEANVVFVWIDTFSPRFGDIILIIMKRNIAYHKREKKAIVELDVQIVVDES